MRRLLVVTSAVVLVETIFFAALAPLLPGFADELGLEKGEAGLLVASYALGAFAGAIPAGLFASRVDARAAAVGGLLLLAGTSVAFGVVDGFVPLVLSRFAQGASGAFCWTGALAWLVSVAPRERRCELIGIAMAFAIGGALLGPVLGGAAAELGRAAAFGAVAGLCVAIAALALRAPRPARGSAQPLRTLAGALRSRRVLAGMWLLALPAFLFGTLSVLTPLQLDRLGWGAVAVAATFFVSAGVEASVSPLVGRWSDRRGRLAPIWFGLAASALVSLVIPWVDQPWPLAVVVVGAAVAYGVFWTPAVAMLSDGWEAAGVEHGLGFALMNLAFAPGNVLGSAAGGALADVGGDVVSYAMLAGLCVVTFAVLARVPHGARPPAPGPLRAGGR